MFHPTYACHMIYERSYFEYGNNWRFGTKGINYNIQIACTREQFVNKILCGFEIGEYKAMYDKRKTNATSEQLV